MKKYKDILLILIIVLYAIVTLSLTHKKHQKTVCANLNISILNKEESGFVSEEDIKNIINQTYEQIYGTRLASINGYQLEQIMQNNPLIKNVKLHKSINGTLNIKVAQRTPIVRIIPEQGTGYYIDKEKKIIPLSDKHTARTIIANGHINDSYAVEHIFPLVERINQNPFWKAQIDQIYVTPEQEIELIPKVGDHIIYFGTSKDYAKKFEKLLALYQQGFKKYGWNNYKSINLKYENQIICTKK